MSVGPLQTRDLSNYKRKGREDGSHLRLGITYKGMLLFLKEINMIEWTGEGREEFHRNHAAGGGLDHPYLKWKFRQQFRDSYVRDKELEGRIGKTAGPVLQVDTIQSAGLRAFTGYDLIACLKKFLQENRLTDMSICEVILTQERFKHIRSEVGIANVFWSHVQIEPFMGSCSTMKSGGNTLSTLCNMVRKAEECDVGKHMQPADSRFIWLDYYCLRQCCNEFDLKRVIHIIGDIGLVVAALGRPVNTYGTDYVSRSFCIIELYAAVLGKCNIICCPNRDKFLDEVGDVFQRKNMQKLINLYPIDCKKATTWSAEEKKNIDRYIESMPGGFDYLNRTIEKAMLDSCPQQN